VFNSNVFFLFGRARRCRGGRAFRNSVALSVLGGEIRRLRSPRGVVETTPARCSMPSRIQARKRADLHSAS